MWLYERQIEGVITSFSLISTSADESLYEIRLEHKLALLSRRKRSAIYLNTNVPKLVTQILKEHAFADYEIDFDTLVCLYPNREMIVQWEESDLAFISRILAEVGIWFRSQITMLFRTLWCLSSVIHNANTSLIKRSCTHPTPG